MINIIAVVLSVLILSRLCYHYFRSFGCNETEQPFDDRVAVEVLQQKATLKVRRAQKRRIIFLILLQRKLDWSLRNVKKSNRSCAMYF